VPIVLIDKVNAFTEPMILFITVQNPDQTCQTIADKLKKTLDFFEHELRANRFNLMARAIKLSRFQSRMDS